MALEEVNAAVLIYIYHLAASLSPSALGRTDEASR